MKNKFLITGANGQLAKAFQRFFDKQDVDYLAVSRAACDISNVKQVEKLIDEFSPNVLINTAAYNQVDLAEDNSEKAFLVNAEAPHQMALLCKQRRILLIHYSSDYVFDGKKRDGYLESDNPNPLSVYGKSKLAGENKIMQTGCDYLIFRLSWVFGDGQQNFLYKLSQWAKQNTNLKVTSDEISVPTYTETIVDLTLLSIEKNLKGLYHLTNSGIASRFEVADYFIKASGLVNTLEPVSIQSFNAKATRPLNSAMSNQRLAKALDVEIQSWQDAIKQFIKT